MRATILGMLFLVVIVGCVPTQPSPPTPDIPATVDAAVQRALPVIEATLEYRLKAILLSLPTPTLQPPSETSTPVPTPRPTPTSTPQPTPTLKATSAPWPTPTPFSIFRTLSPTPDLRTVPTPVPAATLAPIRPPIPVPLATPVLANTPTPVPTPILVPTSTVAPIPILRPTPTPAPTPAPTPITIRDVEFVGTAILDDIPVRDGTLIVAKIDGFVAGSAEVEDGRYNLRIREDLVQSLAGGEIVFKIGLFQANKTAVLGASRRNEVNLTGTKYLTSALLSEPTIG